MKMKNIKTYENFINEGLIKSYDKSDVEKYIKKFNFNDDQYTFNGDQLILDVNINHKDVYKEMIKTLENVYGWYVAGFKEDYWEPIESDTSLFVDDIEYNLSEMSKDGWDYDEAVGFLYFEPKYSKNTIKNVPDTVYHVTDKKYLDKIKSKGLIPKHKDKITKHPDRIYLFLDKKNIKGLLDNIHFDVEDPYLLTIDVSDYKEHNKFFEDPYLKEGGVYVLQNIPPNLITDIQRI